MALRFVVQYPIFMLLDQALPPSITYDNALRLAHSTLAALQQKLSTVSSITAPDLSALHSAELSKLLAGVTIAEGGVLPNIQSVLLPKKTGKKDE
ncbi:hypothetical protein APUTEX25_002099 [Auxenochlorella protothecoides]|uniref:Histone H2A C-terminal domain-containing protein n=1 Tax=Auxenochlorella protothecoides TaxID=3075 RepID=A0A3M7KVF9_AUXPR|nr:hypothetical protein APUTEX25_002099 [Auxenochlorella protothecoides]|eukprot:RMZ54523.1 hypothetical protein APUTEX25_002099 [Auxenochlorella protothecoides]